MSGFQFLDLFFVLCYGILDRFWGRIGDEMVSLFWCRIGASRFVGEMTGHRWQSLDMSTLGDIVMEKERYTILRRRRARALTSFIG